MAIPESHRLRKAYHFTSLQNLESIIESGLLSTNIKLAKGVGHINVAEESIQNRRSTMIVPGQNGRVVHDYVPFYFAKKTPMQLAVLNKKNVDQELLIYFSIPVSIIESRAGVLFTNASANTDIAPNFYSVHELPSLNDLNWNVIDDNRWSYPDDDERHQKMAELLIPDQVFLSEISEIITWNGSISNYVKRIFEENKIAHPPVIENSYHYYCDPCNWNCSLITGPLFLKKGFEETVNSIKNSAKVNPKFPDLPAAISAVRNDFGVIKELADIDGLGADYGPHKDDVGTHSKRVADLVKCSPEYARASEYNKLILEMAAYLHDIGKGPKSRWNNNFMSRADNNHAKRSLPMLERILTEDIGSVPDEAARRLVMLVTYDDLLGDIAANGRAKSQLFDIITSADDIEMLVAISKADIGAINQGWLDNVSDDIDNLRAEVLGSLQSLGQ